MSTVPVAARDRGIQGSPNSLPASSAIFQLGSLIEIGPSPRFHPPPSERQRRTGRWRFSATRRKPSAAERDGREPVARGHRTAGMTMRV